MLKQLPGAVWSTPSGIPVTSIVGHLRGLRETVTSEHPIFTFNPDIMVSEAMAFFHTKVARGKGRGVRCKWKRQDAEEQEIKIRSCLEIGRAMTRCRNML